MVHRHLEVVWFAVFSPSSIHSHPELLALLCVLRVPMVTDCSANNPAQYNSYRGAGQGFCGDNGRTPAPVLEVSVASQQRRWETKPHHGPLPCASQAEEGIVIILEGQEEEHCCNDNGKHPNHEPNKVFSILLQQLVPTVDCIVVPASTTEPNNALLTRMVCICQLVIMME